VRAEQAETAAGGRAGFRFAGEGLALLATVLWAGSFILARGLRDDVPPVALNFWRWAVASVVVMPFTLRPTVSSVDADLLPDPGVHPPSAGCCFWVSTSGWSRWAA
jgi:drug/metabolite transporter (DMT)-like permease